MFSPLARGYGTWTGEIELNPDRELTELQLPSIPEDQSRPVHRHGVTVSPRVFRSNTNLSISSHKEDGELELPKTYVTKKGALLLFTAPNEDIEGTQDSIKLHHQKKVESLLDCSLKLNTLERLYLSALQFGDLSYYRKDKCSITDPENQWFLKFLHDFDRLDIDVSTKPGADVNFYLRDLKTRSSQRIHAGGDSTTRRQRSQELRSLLHELEDVWRSNSKSSLKPESSSVSQSRTGSTQRILSSKSLAASIKSSTYLGRAESSATDFTKDEIRKLSGTSPVTLPDISSKHGRRRKASWISPVTTSVDAQDTQPVAITRLQKDKRLSSAKSDRNGGRRSAESRSGSRLSGRTGSSDLDDARSSSADSSRLTEDTDEINAGRPLKMFIDNDLIELTEDVVGIDLHFDQAIEGDVLRIPDEITPERTDHENTKHTDKFADVGAPGGELTQGFEPREKDNQKGGPISVASSQHQVTAPLDLAGQGGKQYTESPVHDDSAASPSEEIATVSQPETAVDKVQEQRVPRPPPDPRRERLHRLNARSKKLIELPSTGKDMEQTTEIDTSNTETNEEQKTAEAEKTFIDASQRDSKTEELRDGPKTEEVEQVTQDVNLEKEDTTSPHTSDNIGDQGVAENDKDPSINKEFNETEGSVKKEVKEAVEEGEEQKEGEETEELSKDSVGEDTKNVIHEASPEESEESMSFVFVKDNSTTGSASVGKHEPEEDIMEVLERRRRARMLSEMNIESTNFDDMEDDFAERAKEAEKAEQEFIFIREEDSDGEAVDPAEPERKSKRSRRKGALQKPEKVYVKALDITSIAPVVEEEEVKEEEEMIEEEGEDKPWVHPNQRFFPEGPLPKLEVPEEDTALPSHLEEMLTRRSASKSAEELEKELLQMQDIMNKGMAGSSMAVDDGEEGLTEQELKLAQELLQDRVKEVSSKIFNTGTEEEATEPVVEVQSKKKGGKSKGKGGKGRKKRTKEPIEPVVDRKQSIAEERDSIRQQRKLEKLRKLEEMQALQDKIAKREELRKTQEEEIQRKAMELVEEQADLEQEAAAIKRNEEEAREQLAEIRRKQRLERDERRKAEQERKRQLAIERREREKVMREIARQKEKEMLERIGDVETRRELIADEERRIEEEERIADEALQEELKEQQIALEEEELRMRELEKEAEEEAMRRLIEEREETERRQRELKEEEERIRQEEEKLRQALLLEEERLREEKRLKELEQQMKLDEERKRLDELKRLEEEARDAMRQELEYKREWAIKRREQNLNRRAHLDKIRIGQGLTRPWVFSYFVLWKKESFSKLMGRDQKSKNSSHLKAKRKPNATADTPGSPPPEFMPGLTAIAEE